MEKNELIKLRDKRNNLFIGIVGSVITTLSGLIIVAISPAIGFGVASLAVGLGCMCYKDSQKLNETEKRLLQEQEHKRLYVNENNEDIKVKADMLIDSIGLRKNSEKSLENAKIITASAYTLTFLGVINTFINPTNLWMPILGIGCSVMAGYYELNKHKNNEVIRNRIHNLSYDLEVAEEISKKEELQNNITKCLEKNEISEVKVSEEELDLYNSVIDSLEEKHREKPKSYIKRKGGK